jgi:hypothetical protein
MRCSRHAAGVRGGTQHYAIQGWSSEASTSTSGTDFVVVANGITITGSADGDVTVDGTDAVDTLTLIQQEGDLAVLWFDETPLVLLSQTYGGVTVNLGGSGDFFEARYVDAFVGGLEVNGGNGDDWIYGSYGPDVLRGDDGDDSLYGDDGDDTLYGGDDDDILYGHAGDDTLYGGAGTDELYGGDDDDTLYGYTETDAGSTTDHVYGESGRDKLFATGYLYGGEDYDSLRGGDEKDRLFGHSGTDLGTVDDFCEFGPGDDVLGCLNNATSALSNQMWSGRMYSGTEYLADGYTPSRAAFMTDYYTGVYSDVVAYDDTFAYSYFLYTRVLNESGYDIEVYAALSFYAGTDWYPLHWADNYNELLDMKDGDAVTAVYTADLASHEGDTWLDEIISDGFKLGLIVSCNGVNHAFTEDTIREPRDTNDDYWTIVITPEACESASDNSWEGSFYYGLGQDEEALAAAMD